eukprot:2987634-Prymnesium_polylepis.1
MSKAGEVGRRGRVCHPASSRAHNNTEGSECRRRMSDAMMLLPRACEEHSHPARVDTQHQCSAIPRDPAPRQSSAGASAPVAYALTHSTHARCTHDGRPMARAAAPHALSAERSRQ